MDLDGLWTMERIQVASDRVQSVGYDVNSLRLEVQLIGGGIFRFIGVPRHVYHELMRAPSIAEYLFRILRPEFRYEWLG
jgi:hypothetical protein